MHIKERPRCRKVIVERGYRPYLVDREWDGLHCVDPDGRRTGMSDGLRLQMKKMILEGYWGEVGIKPSRLCPLCRDFWRWCRCGVS